MAVSTYKAQLNYYDPTYGWGNEGTTCQGNWDGAGGNRTGVMYFPGLAALKGKIINSVQIKTTNTKTGWNAPKTAYFYRSAAQGGIQTSLKANHKTGDSIGSYSENFHANTNASSSFEGAFLKTYIEQGEDTFCLYAAGDTNYLKWSAVTLEVNWSEPSSGLTFDKSSVELGTPVQISVDAANSAYTHRFRYKFGSASGTIATDVESSYAWTPPLTLAEQIPSAVSGSCTIYCDTYNGSTLLGTKSAQITLTVPTSVIPTAGTLTASIVDDTSGSGQYVMNMCKARLQLTGAEGVYGSTIKSTKISGGGWTGNGTDMTTGVLTKAGTITFTATVTDSRNRTATASCNIEVLDYAKPKIISCTYYRCDASGTAQNNGTYVAIRVEAENSANSAGALTITVAYKQASASGYGSETALNNNELTVIGGSLAASSTYHLRITVSDAYGSVSKVYTLGTKKVLLSFLGRLAAVAIGKVAEIANTFDVALNARFREKTQFDREVLLRDEEAGSSAISLVKQFTNGLYIGNSVPMDATGLFSGMTGAAGFFIDTEKAVAYVVDGEELKDLHTDTMHATFG